MAIIKMEDRTITVQVKCYYCEDCGKEMFPAEDPIIYTLIPPQEKYVCSGCGKEELQKC